ncbi:YbaB/EbfC family DNA-binding protein [Candidatus Parcubacteria bacterium]|nr:MAG: YbaB/EbfC family DNA-binding protein [Candidatus Parcubacteria bacterium]
MFNPLKGVGDLKKLRDEAMKLQQELKKIEVTSEKNDISVVVTGDMKVKSIKMDGEEMFDLKEIINKALEESQKKAASKMQQMGGGIQNLLGK